MENLISKLCSFMGVFALVQTFVPPTLREWLDRSLEALWEKFFQTADPYVYLEVEEKSGHSFNAFYKEVGVYLSSLRSSIDTHPRLKVFRSEESNSYSFSLPYNEPLENSFEGAHVWWTHTCREKEGGKGNSSSEDERSYTLKFLKADKAIILPAYLDHVSKLAVEIEHRSAQRHLYTNNYGGWEKTPFNHPSTFDTLALDEGLADRIKADLDNFSKGEKFYHKNGRAWKRGYLLYGPPGTGKSSMIAAIANYLKFDIYDLELTKVYENSELKSLLIQTTRKSIIVIEDIDCTVQFPDRTAGEKMSDAELATGEPADESTTNAPDGGTKLTLSGLLNFTDGLWSCCGEERIFIFTTNHKDRLDPALLRPGRMDMHILLSYCTFAALKKMAINYLSVQDHHMYPALQETMECTPHEVTPAAIAELLISNQNDADAAFKQVMAIFQGSSAHEEVHNGDDKSHLELQASPKKRRRRRTVFIFSVKSKHTD